ncbi:MAG TPA: DUF1269 domain-containing protein [Burkholderiales bacterium]|nr:DUF1269 domain-containing protein [Burkholderiales bacterium]
MSDLVVVTYKGEDTADQVLNKLRELQKEYLVDLEDAVVAVRDSKGKVRIKQAVPLVRISAVSGLAWGGLFGLLVGLLFLNPLLGWLSGAAMGAGAGALSGALADYGINDDFIKDIGKSLEPGTSAIFMLVRRMTYDKVLPELKRFGGTILKTSLSNEQEERLRRALEDASEAVAA